MGTAELNVVTGAFGYTGRYIASRLLSSGKRVRTITGHPNRPNPFGDRVEVAPFNFDRPDELVRSLEGATTLFNTYWIRFPYGKVTYDSAVENSITLIECAAKAGVRRIVHVSILNASEDSPLPYFKGKGRVERAILESGLTYAILRPTLIFGPEGILINNIAWLLRRFPVFGIPGSGDYRVRPVFVEDVAKIAECAASTNENTIIECVGPEIYTFNELVRTIADAVHSRARIVHLEPGLALALSQLIGRAVNDVVLTRDEVKGLMANLLVSDGPSSGPTCLSDWLARNADIVGVKYASELQKHYRGASS